MQYIQQVCTWETYVAIKIMAVDGLSSCDMYIYDDELHVAVISNLYVDECHRQSGRATDLLDYCESLARQRNCTELQLRSDNDNFVRQWYYRRGFELLSSQVWLKKPLQSI